jgi:hypothetical protein
MGNRRKFHFIYNNYVCDAYWLKRALYFIKIFRRNGWVVGSTPPAMERKWSYHPEVNNDTNPEINPLHQEVNSTNALGCDL